MALRMPIGTTVAAIRRRAHPGRRHPRLVADEPVGAEKVALEQCGERLPRARNGSAGQRTIGVVTHVDTSSAWGSVRCIVRRAPRGNPRSVHRTASQRHGCSSRKRNPSRPRRAGAIAMCDPRAGRSRMRWRCGDRQGIGGGIRSHQANLVRLPDSREGERVSVTRLEAATREWSLPSGRHSRHPARPDVRQELFLGRAVRMIWTGRRRRCGCAAPSPGARIVTRSCSTSGTRFCAISESTIPRGRSGHGSSGCAPRSGGCPGPRIRTLLQADPIAAAASSSVAVRMRCAMPRRSIFSTRASPDRWRS